MKKGVFKASINIMCERILDEIEEKLWVDQYTDSEFFDEVAKEIMEKDPAIKKVKFHNLKAFMVDADE